MGAGAYVVGESSQGSWISMQTACPRCVLPKCTLCVLCAQFVCDVSCHVCVLHTQEIKITGATIFTNPFQELEDEEKGKEQAAAKQVREQRALVLLVCLGAECVVVACV